MLARMRSLAAPHPFRPLLPAGCCLLALVLALSPVAAQSDLPYRHVSGWGEFPPDYLPGGGMAVAVDSEDRVWFYTRGSHPVIQFSSGGKLLQAWKENKERSLHQTAAHGMAVGPDGGVWLVDRERNSVFKYSPKGRSLVTIGSFAALTGTNESPYAFNYPAGVAHDSAGTVYVADGYRNTRIAKYTSTGEYLKHWGGPGDADGEFNLVHGITLDALDRVYAADRGNKRIQVFDSNGEHLATWTGLGTPWNVAYDRANDVLWMCDGDLGRITKLSLDGKVLGGFGADGQEPGQLHQVHSIAIDSEGAIYAAETVNQRIQKFVLAE